MKRSAVLIIFILLCFARSHAQQADSLATLRYRTVVDSIQTLSSKQWNADSLSILSWGEKLKAKIQARLILDSLSFSSQLDTMMDAGSAMNTIQFKIDSLQRKKNALLQEVQSKQNELLSKTKGRLEEWKTKIKGKLNLNEVPQGEGLNLPNTSLPDVNGLNIPNTDLVNLNIPDLDLPQLPELEFPAMNNINFSTDLSSLDKSFSIDELDGLKNIQENLGEVGENISKITELSKDPSKALEQSFGEIAEVNKVTDQLHEAEAFKNNELMQKAEMLKDPDAMKSEIKEEVMQRAVNHFGGKEQVLQEAMNKIAKYKAKYESLSSLSDAKKLPKNALRGKPFNERFIPGVAFQFQRNNDLLFLDINPYARYRVTGRFSAGLGWNQRIGYSTRNDYFTSGSVIYGPRLFTEVKTWKGFIARLECEWMNTVVPSMFNKTTDPTKREWVFTPLMGVKKEYRFFKNVKGTVFLMFNLYNPLHKSPYVDLMYSRIGFEFPMRKKV